MATLLHTPAFWYAPPGLAARLLAPLGALYTLAGGLRWALATPQAAPVPVLCVGNLVAGGAGKTPVVLSALETIATLSAAAAGQDQPVVHVVTRGYGGQSGGRHSGPLRVVPGRHDAAMVGDEALLLAEQAPCWVAQDRRAGVVAAVAAGATRVILDDGLQNPALRPDVGVMVVDGPSGFGNGRVIPAGPLREPCHRGLPRATALIVLGEDRYDIEKIWANRGPLLRGQLCPSPPIAAQLAGQPVLAFAGLGRPEKFFATLRALGADLIETVVFPDHHPYREAELVRLHTAATRTGASLVTTAKDAVRLTPEWRARILVLPVRVVWNAGDGWEHFLSETFLRAAGRDHAP